MKDISKKNNSFELTKSIDLNQMRPKGFHRKIDILLKSINKIVTSKSGWVKVLKCPVCGDKKFTNHDQKKFGLVRS